MTEMLLCISAWRHVKIRSPQRADSLMKKVIDAEEHSKFARCLGHRFRLSMLFHTPRSNLTDMYVGPALGMFNIHVCIFYVHRIYLWLFSSIEIVKVY